MANAFSLGTQGSVTGLPAFVKTPPKINLGQGSGYKPPANPLSISAPKPTTPGLIAPSTPVKSTSVTHPDGTVVTQTHHAPTTPSGGQPSYTPPSGTVNVGRAQEPNLKTTGTSPVTAGVFQPAPTATTQPTASQPVQQPSQAITPQSAAERVYQSGQMTPTENKFLNETVQAQQLSNINALSPYAEAQFYGGGGQQVAPDLAAPDLAGRAPGTSALAQNLGNIFGSASAAGLQAATNIANRGATTSENVLNASLPSGTYPFVFNPISGTFTNAQTGGVINAQDAAQAVLNGTMTYDQAKSSLGYLGSTGEAQLQSAIKGINPNANITTLQAQGAAQQSVTGTQEQQKAGYQSALQQGQNLQSQLSDLIGTFGLNPSDVNAVNAGIQKIAQNVSSPQYQILSNYLNDVASTYAQILVPAGGSQTDTTRSIAQGMLNATASGQSIMSVMKALDAAAQAKIAGTVTNPISSNASQSTGSASGGWGSLGD